MKVGLDSSVMVPLANEAHSMHAQAAVAYERLRRSEAKFVITDHALLESFSVLTRAPHPISVPRNEVVQILRHVFGNATIAPIRPGLAWDVMELTLSRGFQGGRIYDAAIALATFEAGARLLLTWNVSHFLSVAPAGLEVREP